MRPNTSRRGSWLLKPLALALYILPAFAQAAESNIGNFGPTGMDVYVTKDRNLVVGSVAPNSPASGVVSRGQIITRVAGKALPEDRWDQRVMLGKAITDAEASDGVIVLTIKGGQDEEDLTRKIEIPVIGQYATDTWPSDCPKTDKIIETNAAHLRSLVDGDGGELTDYSVEGALGILALLSTGTEQDLDAVRTTYRHIMKIYREGSIGSNTWFNGYQGIAACEYYLRTGDQSVMPLINAISASASRWHVRGGWFQWGSEPSPEYDHVNAAGTNMLTVLLLAKQCGAEVNDATLNESLRHFYRFAGHGVNPYGDHRPEDSWRNNNGKTEQIAVAMQVASRAENGEVYAMARDKCALLNYYAYRFMLRGHTGGIGTIWYGLVSSYLADKKPELFRNRQKEVQWFYELSRRHDGSTGLSGAARYDNVQFGRSLILGLTAHRKTLQISGAPKSRYSVPFTLPEMPWGRPADLAFFSLEGGPAYEPLDPAPHVEMDMLSDGVVDLLRMASHPIHTYRVVTAKLLMKGQRYDLIEQLLESADVYARHTGCMAVNNFMPWNVGGTKGWLSVRSIGYENFTPRMFKALIDMVRDNNGPLWLVDQALIALAAASPEQTISRLDLILPWFKHDDWWLRESAAMAASPALFDSEGAKKVMAAMVPMLANTLQPKGRGYVEWMLERNIGMMPADVRHLVPEALKKVYVQTPVLEREEGTMDLTSYNSFNLHNTMKRALWVSPELAPEIAALSASRFPEMRPLEIRQQLNTLMLAASRMDDPASRKGLTEVLTEKYLPLLTEEYAKVASTDFNGSITEKAEFVNQVLQIKGLEGSMQGWHLIDHDPTGEQKWLHASFDPEEKMPEGALERYREVKYPEHLENWWLPEYEVDQKAWYEVIPGIGKFAPRKYRDSPAWKAAGKPAGEVILMRKEFELSDVDYAMARLVVYARQGYTIYVNGNVAVTNKHRPKGWASHHIYLNKNQFALLKQGRNVIAASSFLQYAKGKEGDIEVYLEGLDELPAVGAEAE